MFGMLPAYDTIVLSPHLDDAAYSCGGLIVQQTARRRAVLIVTLMAGDPPQEPFSSFAQSMHTRWELASEIVGRRRAEDEAACRILGAAWSHATLLDAIYRRDAQTGRHYYTSNEALFGPVDAQDAAETVPQITAVLDRLPQTERILAPLGVGNHVDHQLVRLAAEALYSKRLEYYEDFPYSREAGAVSSVIANDRFDLKDETIKLWEDDLQRKVSAMAAFASQISTFFNGRSDIDRQVRAYTEQIGGERYWHRSNGN